MILKELKIQTWIGDPTNCYIIFDEKSKEMLPHVGMKSSVYIMPQE